jgi:streptogramin lyase
VSCSIPVLGLARAATADGPITEFVLPTEGSWPQATTTDFDGTIWFAEHACQFGRLDVKAEGK